MTGTDRNASDALKCELFHKFFSRYKNQRSYILFPMYNHMCGEVVRALPLPYPENPAMKCIRKLFGQTFFVGETQKDMHCCLNNRLNWLKGILGNLRHFCAVAYC